ncbi:hypothetical protein ACJX0J_022907 [Zea mays]
MNGKNLDYHMQSTCNLRYNIFCTNKYFNSFLVDTRIKKFDTILNFVLIFLIVIQYHVFVVFFVVPISPLPFCVRVAHPVLLKDFGVYFLCFTIVIGFGGEDFCLFPIEIRLLLRVEFVLMFSDTATICNLYKQNTVEAVSE